jgi:type III secretion protein U
LSEKTEEPTPKRLKKAHEEGDTGASPFAAQAVAFLATLVVLPSAAVAVASRVSDALRAAIGQAGRAAPTATLDPADVAASVVGYALPLVAVAAAASAVTALVQSGGIVSAKRITPRLDRLDVFQGLKQLFSGARLFAVARASVGAALVAWLVVRALRDHAADVAHATGQLHHAGRLAGALSLSIARDAALVGLALAVIDAIVVRRQWLARLRMTKEEVKREAKEGEGDPELKAARERAHHEMLAAVAVGNVKNATVVVVNPTHLACALRYDEAAGDEAPVDVAKGEGELAERIVRAAHDYGVPVVRDVPLARALVELEIDDAIPEALYEAVAEILRDLWEEQGGGAPSGDAGA